MSEPIRKRLVFAQPVWDDGPGEATIIDAVYENNFITIFDTEGQEIAKGPVTPGDDPWVVARHLLPRKSAPSFWRPMPPASTRGIV